MNRSERLSKVNVRTKVGGGHKNPPFENLYVNGAPFSKGKRKIDLDGIRRDIRNLDRFDPRKKMTW